MGQPPVRSPKPLGTDPGSGHQPGRTPGSAGKTGHAGPTLVKLVVRNATQKNVSGASNWAAVKKDKDYVIVEAVTAPNNDLAEWKQIQWSGTPGEPVKDRPNQRQIPRGASKTFHVEASLGGVKDAVDVWILWAKVEIKTKGPRPANAAPFDTSGFLGTRDGTQNLGAVEYTRPSLEIPLDDSGTSFAALMRASGKITAVATLTPKGVHKVVKSGWALRREVWSHVWNDGVKDDKQSNAGWTDDTSKDGNLRLTPDKEDKIYDTDAPDLGFGEQSHETYHNFRQWVEWTPFLPGEKGTREVCSEHAPWYWQARWHLNRDPKKQITLNKLEVGNQPLPAAPHYPPPKKR